MTLYMRATTSQIIRSEHGHTADLLCYLKSDIFGMYTFPVSELFTFSQVLNIESRMRFFFFISFSKPMRFSKIENTKATYQFDLEVLIKYRLY